MPMTSRLVSILGLALVCASSFLVVGCATTVDPIQRNAPLKMALSEPVENLRERSDAGDRQAQYALSFLMRHGLRGVELDPLGAEALRATAGVTQVRTMPVYQPGVNGRPGSLINVQISDPGISDHDAARLDLCGLTVLGGVPALGGSICGSPAAYIDLLPAAAAVRLEMVRPASVDPASVSDCAAVGPLWSDAALRMSVGDQAGAAAASERIISLCGEGEPSWHARVMRAQIHLDALEPDQALAVMGPVPRPAPAPIGGFASQVAMAAHAARRDASAYGTERDAMLAASLDALRAEPGVQEIATFPVDGGRVTLFDRPGPLFPGLEGLKVGVFSPTAPDAPPRGFWLSVRRDFLDGADAYFLDEYRCDGRASVANFAAEPSLADIRKDIEAYMKGDRKPVTEMRDAVSLACRWPVQIAPGLGDDPLVLARAAAQPDASTSSTPLP